MLNFTAIDFETSWQWYPCSVGLVKVENGMVTDRKHLLIRPHRMFFHPMNISIHGITARDVVNEPEFDELWNEMLPFIEDQFVVAHNASFDMNVLRSTLMDYELALPKFQYACSVKISRRTWKELDSHKLNVIANYIGISFKHHDALADSETCAKIVVNACELTNSGSLEDLYKFYKLKFQVFKPL